MDLVEELFETGERFILGNGSLPLFGNLWRIDVLEFYRSVEMR
jgi:hypothetical protein